MNYTKLDVDNPTLREWSLVVIRNLCSWSEKVRTDLGNLQLIGVSDEGKQALDSLGMRDAYLQQINKLKRPNAETGIEEIDTSNIHIHTVDF